MSGAKKLKLGTKAEFRDMKLGTGLTSRPEQSNNPSLGIDLPLGRIRMFSFVFEEPRAGSRRSWGGGVAAVRHFTWNAFVEGSEGVVTEYALRVSASPDGRRLFRRCRQRSLHLRSNQLLPHLLFEIRQLLGRSVLPAFPSSTSPCFDSGHRYQGFRRSRFLQRHRFHRPLLHLRGQ